MFSFQRGGCAVVVLTAGLALAGCEGDYTVTHDAVNVPGAGTCINVVTPDAGHTYAVCSDDLGVSCWKGFSNDPTSFLRLSWGGSRCAAMRAAVNKALGTG